MSSAEVMAPCIQRSARRFAVTWRNRRTKGIAPVAVLDHGSTGYRFQYLATARDVEDFKPFIGLPEFDRIYEASRLWPFFDLRVMDAKRPDFSAYVSQLGLSSNASRLDILGRSGGAQKGDNVLLVEAPQIASDGTTESIFLVRGSRHVGAETETAAAVAVLRAGEYLSVVDDPTNEANTRALRLLTPAGVPIGWVPDLLIAYARELRASEGMATLLQNNGMSVPWHMRLVVRISGTLPANTAQFEGGDWPPLG